MSQIKEAISAEPAVEPLVRRLLRWGLLLILLDVLIGSTVVGLQLRRWAWDYTEPARFRYDIGRNYRFGREAIEQGYLNVYENQLITQPDEANKINYTPLRLGLFGAWAKWNTWTQADPREWQESHEFNAFLMYFNSSLEWLAAIAAFLLVRHWIWRTGPPPPDATRVGRLLHGSVRATLAFLLLWFNPAMIASAHGWPSTDMWVVPFFLWTVLLACWNRWFLAGVVMGIGAMFKGQQLFTVAMFLLWPIFAGEPGKAIRWLCGFALAATLVVSGWMISYPADADVSTPDRIVDYAALTWVLTAAAGVLIMNGWRIVPRKWRWAWAPVVLLGMGLILRPGLGQIDGWTWALAGLAAIVAAGAIWLPWRSQGYSVAAVISATLLLCIVYFHGTTGWWELGFMYGTERHPMMVVGPGNNLGALLYERFGYHDPKAVVASLEMPAWLAGAPAEGTPAPTFGLQLRHLMLGVFAVLMVISCIAIAKQWRRNDRRFLVAIIVPWLLFYAIPVQVHERYLLYGSAAGAIVIGCSFGLAALNLFLVLLTALQTVNCMMMANGLIYRMDHPVLNADLGRFCDTLRPDISWAVLAATGVFFFAAFTRSRWSRSESRRE